MSDQKRESVLADGERPQPEQREVRVYGQQVEILAKVVREKPTREAVCRIPRREGDQ